MPIWVLAFYYKSVLEDGTWNIMWGFLSLVPEQQDQKPQHVLKSMAKYTPGQGCKKHVCKQKCFHPASSVRHSSWDKQNVREDYVSFLPFISFPGLQPNSSVLFRTFQKALHKVKTSGLHLNSKIKLLFMSPGHLQKQRKNECRHWPIHWTTFGGHLALNM